MDLEHTNPRVPLTSPRQREANLAENPFAGQGPVLLDVGGDVGALIITLPASMEGVEIEIVPLGESGKDHRHVHPPGHTLPDQGPSHHHARHVAVIARRTSLGVVHSAVFPDLVQGTYELNERFGPVRLRIDITGGAVTQTKWPID